MLTKLFGQFVGIIADNLQEFVELDRSRPIIVHRVNYLLDLVHGVYEPEAYERNFELIDTDRTVTIRIQTIKVLSQLADLLIIKVYQVTFAPLSQPFTSELFAHFRLHLPKTVLALPF